MMNINQVVKEGLCTSCGMCYASCPNNSIEITYNNAFNNPRPVIKSSCNDCGICYKVCSGHEVNFDELNNSIFGEIPENNYYGNIEAGYICHSSDENIRNLGSSGGIVSTILLYLIKNKLVDGIINAKFQTNPDLKPTPQIITSEEAILQSCGSLYCVCDVNSIIKNTEKHKNYAFVGLPCHIHSLRKAQEIIPELKERLIFTIGLFCSRNLTLAGSKYLLDKLNIKNTDLKRFQYRGNGYPGDLHIHTDLQEWHLEMKSWYADLFSGSFFENPRCLLCCDALAELADISCGDAWLPEFSSDKLGTSIALLRTEKSTSVWKNLIREKLIYEEHRNIHELLISQAGTLWSKKKALESRFLLRKIFKKKNPVYINSSSKNSFSMIAFILGILCYFNIFVSHNNTMRKFILSKIPQVFLAKYCKFISLIKWFAAKIGINLPI